MASPELTALSIANAPQQNQPSVTSEGQAAAGRIKAARQARNAAMEPTVSATNLAEPVTPVTVPQPEVETIPAGPLNVARNVSRNAQGFIEAQTAERDRLNELQDTFGALSDQGSLSDFFTQQREQFGATPANLQELQDIQLRLSDMDTESGLRKVNIESGGQGASQGVRSLTQEDRENAVRTAGLAARAAVIQGNIETATQLARDAVNIEYQQRTLTANNLLQQISMVQGQVSEQDAQLLEQEKRGYEAELATIQEVKDNVANAMVNGASQAEIAQLTSDQMGDADKIALAQSITARGAGEMRNLQIRQAESGLATDAAQRANIYDQISQRQVARNAELVAAAQAATTGAEQKRIEDEAASEGLLGIQAVLADLENAPGFSSAVGFGFKKSGAARTLAGAGTGAAIGAGAGSVVPIVGTAIGGVVGGVGGGIAGFFAGDEAIAGSSRADFEVQATRLSDMFLVENLDKMTGVLTDKDLEVLRSEGTTIGNFDQSEESWLQERNRLTNMVNRGLQQHGITAEQVQYYYGVGEDVLTEAEQIWGGNAQTTAPLNFDY